VLKLIVKGFYMKMKNYIYAFLAISLMGCVKPTPEELANADYGDYPSNYEEIAKASVSERLIDPYSAQFTFRPPAKTWNGFGGGKYGWAVCGTFNAKNRMGGYTGSDYFFVMIKNGIAIQSNVGVLAQGFCK
jgi:hypothetical protein